MIRFIALVALVLLSTGCATTSSVPDLPPLHAAAKAGEAARLQQLLDRGADVNARDANNDTPLMIAATYNEAGCLRLLLDRGASVDLRNSSGATALVTAALNGYVDSTQLLLARGADVNAKTTEGSSAVVYAALNGHTACVQLLLEHGAEQIDSAYTIAQGRHPDTVALIGNMLRAREALQQEPLIAAMEKASLTELIVATDPSANMANKRNYAIIAAKARDLPALLHDGTSADLTALSVRLEQTILGLNHEIEVLKDGAQNVAVLNNDPQLATELRGRSICFRERIELLKPILTAIKEELANRAR